MGALTRFRLIMLAVVIAVCGCATPPQGRSGDGAGQPGGQPAAPKRVVVTIMDDPPSLSDKLSPPSIRGVDALEELVHVGLVTLNNDGFLTPRLAEDVPTLENGLWKVLPDGRMETTWRIREGVLWQDGTPFTADDIAFTARVARDREIPDLRDTALDLVERVDTPDPRTVVLTWSRAYVDADTMFTRAGGPRARTLPLPVHLLNRAYEEDKATFTQLPYWSEEFVGTGPYKLKEWARGSHLVLAANDRYLPWRPRIDEIEVRFIPDPNTLVANVLAGEIAVTMGRGLSLEQALTMREQWANGRMEANPSNWLIVWPQFINPTPRVVGNVQFRRAMLQAIDRQSFVDGFVAGLSSVAHTYLSPSEPDFYEITREAPRYDYDPARTAQLIEGLGFTKGADGMFRDASGQPLAVEIRTTAGDTLRERIHLSVTDSWQRAGVAVNPVVVPRQLAVDQEYRANFPAFELSRNPNTLRDLPSLQGKAARTPENGYRGTGGTNYSRYQNPEFDALVDRYFVTIEKPERVAVARQIVTHIAEQVTALGMLYATDQNMIANRMINVAGRARSASETWNAHEWDVK
jgi:peptide/nickel transport system substrate-binding protein